MTTTWTLADGVARRIRSLWTQRQDTKKPDAQPDNSATEPGIPWERFRDAILTALLPFHEAREAVRIALERVELIPCT